MAAKAFRMNSSFSLIAASISVAIALSPLGIQSLPTAAMPSPQSEAEGEETVERPTAAPRARQEEALEDAVEDLAQAPEELEELEASEDEPEDEASVEDEPGEDSDASPEVNELEPEALEDEPSVADPLEAESEDLPDAVPVPTDPATFGLQEGDRPVTVPEYLNSPANPLTFPTRPEEVELQGTQPITLEQAIELARRNSTDVQEALLQLEQTRAALRQSQAQYLPSLDANATLTRQATNTFSSSPFPGIPTEPITTESTTLNGSINLTYDIFTSGQRSALVRAAEERVRLQELQLEVVSEQLRLNVTQGYYNLQETDELVRIATQSLEEALQSLRDAQALERAGVGTRFDVLQAEVEVANSRQDLIQSLSDREVAQRQLAQIINSYESIDLSAADPIELAGLWELSLEESIVLAYQNRAELEQQLVQRDVSEQQRRAELAALGPRLSAFAQYSFVDLLDESQSPSDSESYSIGLQAAIQLYDGGAARAAARQQELNIALAENAFEEVRRVVRFEVEQSYSSLQANFESIQTATIAVDTATEALRLARLRFQAGVGTQTDVLQAQTDLTRAEVNRLRAVLGYNRALAQLQRAVSRLPDSDLSARP
jgi:outer membrane protein TolC